MEKYYFAYGSCMDYEGRIKKSGYQMEFEPVGVALLEGYGFRMNKISRDGVHVFANIEKAQEEKVYGILYKITDRVEKDYLDVREGYPTHYRKEMVAVTFGKKIYKDVLVYIAQSNFICSGPNPTAETYEQELRRGAAKLPKNYKEKSYFQPLISADVLKIITPT